MTEIISIKEMPEEIKSFLLKELGYTTDGVFVLDKNGEKHQDRYTQEPVQLNNMAIFPGSTIILDNNSLSVSLFLEEFGDVL